MWLRKKMTPLAVPDPQFKVESSSKQFEDQSRTVLDYDYDSKAGALAARPQVLLSHSSNQL